MRWTTRRIHERPLDLWHHHPSIPLPTPIVILMDSPQSLPSSTPLGSAHSSNHLGSSDGARAHEDVMGLPWCHACRPYVHVLLSQGTPSTSIAGASTAAPTWAFSSPFPDYICVPALVHRSQLAVFATPVMNPTTAASPNPSIDSVSSGSPIQRRAKGVKIACTNCRTANKKCDEGRPCGRCMKLGMDDSCVSAQRKQRIRRVKQTTTAITVSATQVAVETPIPGDGPSVSIPASVHIKAGASYVSETQEMADASYSSPVGSPLLADLDSHFTAAQYPGYSVYANNWPTQTSTEHHYPHWGYGSDGTHQHPAAQFGGSVVGMPPDGCGGAGGMFQSPRQQF
ncbi:hypothetical protein K466DRAFT_233530 [Polyporus arcularius HHB13444]|uniref:Transcription activator of gluconeogenesis ERT1 n=1 Tax=Polyporus arcularius HHB13444 TaxID=1314778 RepID=A0A5C3P4N4_9APHY|nr:hypothetical protein K466DRAFT_233530 [Polyporus arcularius HHB13444]